MRQVAIIYARFGPYHVARLRATRSFFYELNTSVIGIEVCPDDKYYAWNKVSSEDEICRVAVLPDRHYRDSSFREIQQSVLKALDEVNPDVVVLPGWYYAESLAGLRWAGKNKRTSILMSESCRHDAKRTWWKELIKRKRVQRFSAALVGGPPHARYLTELGMREDLIFYGHNVVDNEYFQEESDKARQADADMRKSHGLPARYILASGRFLPHKNFTTLIEAYGLYYERADEKALPLVLCGDGEERTNVAARIREHRLQDRVHLPGFVQYQDLPIYYGLASAFVHPSMIEPWGLVVNEAMAAGLPVLVSNRCGCAPDLVQDGVNGFTFDPADTNQIAGLLMRVSELDGELSQMGRASREIISHWGTDRFAKGLWQAIQAAEDC